MTPLLWATAALALIVLLAVVYAVLSVLAAAAIEKHLLKMDQEPSPIGRRVGTLDLSDIAAPRQRFPKDAEKLRIVTR